MKNPLISIIVPVYKTEQYLRKCVDSILAQTYTNIEVILIDDGSPDGSPILCDEYAQNDSRVKVIHQKNAGVSAARNAGLDIAAGEYIGFVDSDDWIEPDMYEVLMDIASKSGADIAASASCGEMISGGGDKSFVHLSKEEAIIGLFSWKYDFLSVCGKLYKCKMFYSIRFPNGVSINEDAIVSLQTIIKSNIICYTHYQSYHYILNPKSATHTLSNKYISMIQSHGMLENEVREYNSDLVKFVHKRILKKDISTVIEAADNGWLTKDVYRDFANDIAKCKNKQSLKLIPNNYRLWLTLFSFGRAPFIIGRKVYRTFIC